MLLTFSVNMTLLNFLFKIDLLKAPDKSNVINLIIIWACPLRGRHLPGFASLRASHPPSAALQAAHAEKIIVSSLFCPLT